MGGGTQLLLGAHLTGANMRFCRESGKCRDHISYLQGCDLEVGKIMYPKITTLMSKKLKIMYIFQKIMY